MRHHLQGNLIRRTLKISIILFSAMVMTKFTASIIGHNDFIPVNDDDLSAYPDMDEDLKQIIRRTVLIKHKNGYGTALLLGDEQRCSKVITAKHISHYLFKASNGHFQGRLRSPKKSFYIDYKGKKYHIVSKKLRSFKRKWSVKDESIVYEIEPIQGASCATIPYVTRQHLEKFTDCRVIGYPSDVIRNKKGMAQLTGYSAIPTTGKTPFPYTQRGMASCKVLDVVDGTVITDCDRNPGISGGPIVCKTETKGGKKWAYVSTLNGGKCKVNGEKVPACYSSQQGPALNYTQRFQKNGVFSTGSSLRYTLEFP